MERENPRRMQFQSAVMALRNSNQLKKKQLSLTAVIPTTTRASKRIKQ